MSSTDDQEPDIKQAGQIFHVEVDKLGDALRCNRNHQNEGAQHQPEQRLPDFRGEADVHLRELPRLYPRERLDQRDIRLKQEVVENDIEEHNSN